MKTNFHMHTNFSDGQDNAEDYVLAAIAKGMQAIGFSDHVPLSIKNEWSMRLGQLESYFSMIKKLKEKYAKQIEIYAGLEMDYLVMEDRSIVNKYIAKADYTIGAVHYLYDHKSQKYYSADGSALEVKTAFAVIGGGDNRVCVETYYRELIRMLHEYKPNILGHLDIIRKRNYRGIYFDEKANWYHKLIDKVLDAIACSQVIVEVNMGALLYDGLSEPYPAIWILEKCYQKEIPIILNSDAHKAKDVDKYFNEAITILRKIGFKQQKILQGGCWKDVVLSEIVSKVVW